MEASDKKLAQERPDQEELESELEQARQVDHWEQVQESMRLELQESIQISEAEGEDEGVRI